MPRRTNIDTLVKSIEKLLTKQTRKKKKVKRGGMHHVTDLLPKPIERPHTYDKDRKQAHILFSKYIKYPNDMYTVFVESNSSIFGKNYEKSSAYGYEFLGKFNKYPFEFEVIGIAHNGHIIFNNGMPYNWDVFKFRSYGEMEPRKLKDMVGDYINNHVLR